MINNYFIKALLILFSIFIWNKSEAKHIIGGEITYKCNGVDPVDTNALLYTFKLTMYRDCFSGGANFDEKAVFGFFYKKGNSYTNLTSKQEELVNRGFVEAPDIACLVTPPNICVEKAEYIINISLKILDNESIIVAYQRCCRNNSITNLIAPGDQGITISVELTKDAFKARSSSPTFKQFPPTVICAGEPLNFDHSAIDIENDSLAYEFCSPYKGGGKKGSDNNGGLASDCDGVIPDPTCPPPYQNVDFASPTYSFFNPMGGVPQVKIDPITGIITGKPQLLGQFVVGVCIKEYRNRVLFSIVKRDFQFNVLPCEKAVFAKIKADKEINKQFIVNLCGDSTVHFENLSTKDQFLKEFDWRIYVGNDTIKYNTKNPSHTFPGLGSYNAALYLNPNSIGQCRDTAKITINVFPGIKADYSYTYDTCIAGPTTFKDLSKSNAGPILKWYWDYNDGKTDNIQNPIHLFAKPGSLDVALVVSDKNDCKDTAINNVIWYPVPALLIVDPSLAIGCIPASVTFSNLSYPIDSTYKVEWEFGDGGTSNKISPTYIYKTPGIFNVSLKVTSPIGCTTHKKFSNFVEMRPSPFAGFTYSPIEVTNFNKKVTFTDQSIDAETFYWRFGDFGSFTTNLKNPIYTFPDTGVYNVIQIVTHKSGCKDTANAIIDVIPKVTYFLPNALTPNGDGKNDEYLGNGFMLGSKNFKFSIWNRWGEQVFYTEDFNEGWNGQKNNTGDMSPNGVYVCVVTFTGPRGEPHSYKTFVTLLR